MMRELAREFSVLDDDPGVAIEIERGGEFDYARLAHLHYRPGSAPVGGRVLTARVFGSLAGVLVTGRATLDGSWRRALFAGAFGEGEKTERARLVNAHLRRIARVIVVGRFRGLGVATALVRAYLASPETRYTEALAAMGRSAPFFRAAGMREIEIPPRRHDLRLARVLAEQGIEAWRWADVGVARRQLLRDSVLERALRTWARENKQTRSSSKTAPPEELAVLAAAALTARPMAYAFDAEHPEAHTMSACVPHEEENHENSPCIGAERGKRTRAGTDHDRTWEGAGEHGGTGRVAA